MRYLTSLAGVAALALLGLTGTATSASAKPLIATEGWYGYAVTGSTYTSTTADWIVPALACSTSFSDLSIADWTGLDGYSSPTTEQTGIAAECVSGKTTYLGFYDLYPDPVVDFSDTVKAGDTIDASVTYDGSSNFTLKLSDVTQGWTQTVVKALSGADRSSAETIVEAPSTLSCVPHETLGAFTGDTVNGKSLGSLSPVEVNAGNPNITVSAVSGDDFSVSCT
jgi:hypothetical protein